MEPVWFWLGWVGLVPWLVLLDRTRSLRGALGAGLLMSTAFVVAVFAWFAFAIAEYTAQPPVVTFLFLVACAPLLQPQLVIFPLVRHMARARALRASQAPTAMATGLAAAPPLLSGIAFWHATLAGAFAYVATEWLWPKLFGDTLGHGFYASPLMRQAADLAGAPGLTFVLIVANECMWATIARGLRGRAAGWVADGAGEERDPAGKQGSGPQLLGPWDALTPAACVAVLVVMLLAYGAVRVRQIRALESAGHPVTAGLIQADIAKYDRLRADVGTFTAVQQILDAHLALSHQARGRGHLDVLIWPETVYPTTFGTPKSETGAMFDRAIGAFVSSAGIPLIFGSYDTNGTDEFNAAFFLEPGPDKRLSFDAYRKARLFPLTERVPAPLESSVVRAWLPWLGTWKPGDSVGTMAVTLRDGRQLRVAPLICLDAVDPSLALAAVRRGAEVIVTLSNDSWFADGNGPHLHLVVSAFRSLETRRPQLRATNTGISAVITATGDMIASAGVHERTAVVASVVPISEAKTLMLAWGDWFGPTSLVGALLLLAATRLRARR